MDRWFSSEIDRIRFMLGCAYIRLVDRGASQSELAAARGAMKELNKIRRCK